MSTVELLNAAAKYAYKTGRYLQADQFELRARTHKYGCPCLSRREGRECAAVEDARELMAEIAGRIAEALDLIDRFDTPGDRGRTRMFVSDLKNILRGAR